jgi:hypothetical protein
MTREKLVSEFAGLIGEATANLQAVERRLKSGLFTNEEIAETSRNNAEVINSKFKALLEEYSKP